MHRSFYALICYSSRTERMVGVRGKTIHYYAAGNTAYGFYSLYDSVLDGLDRLFILKGGPGTGKSTMMKAIGEHFVARGYDIEYIHCASDDGSIDGVILTDERIGVVDGTAPHVIEPKALKLIDEYVHLGDAIDRNKLLPYKNEILSLNERIGNEFHRAYDTFKKALLAHKEVENIYIKEMDFHAANLLTDDLIQRMFNGKTLTKKGKRKRRFLGAATPLGARDFIPNLTERIEKRYFIKGRAGSGKSTLLNKIAEVGLSSGYDVEVYHCGFDPKSLDMVIIPEISVAIFDSTKPHEYFPSREEDELIDMYKHCFPPGTDERYAAEIKRHTETYRQRIREATSHLKEAKSLRSQLESYYMNATDFSKIDAIKDRLIEEIDAQLSE